MASKQGCLQRKHLSHVQMFALQLSIILEQRDANEEMMYNFKTAVVSHNPADLAPAMFPEWFPEEAESVVTTNEPVQFKFTDDMTISASEYDEIMAKFNRE